MGKKKTHREETPNSWKFFDGYAEAANELDDWKQEAMFVYQLYCYAAWGEEPDFSWAQKDPALARAVKMAWHLAEPSLDKSVQDSQNGKKAPKDGKRRRGRPRKTDEVSSDAQEVCAKMAAVNTKEDKSWQETDCSDYEMVSAIPSFNDPYAEEDYEDTCPF